jgi:hypothetical protein
VTLTSLTRLIACRPIATPIPINFIGYRANTHHAYTKESLDGYKDPKIARPAHPGHTSGVKYSGKSIPVPGSAERVAPVAAIAATTASVLFSASISISFR